MSGTEAWMLDATAQAELVRRGEVAPRELVEITVRRAERFDGVVNSIVHPRFDPALDDAAHVDRTAPLAGVPFAVKDWTCLQGGEPATWGMRALAEVDRRATHSSELAERYRRAGLVSIGRTNLPELAFGPPTTEPDLHGPCRNPWDTERSVGGSSGGSAAVVAARIVPVANASDGGGSLRIPAACCGLVGLKVSRGRITNAPNADGRGTKVEGHIARTVRDVAGVLDVSHGPGTGDVYVAPPPRAGWLASAASSPPPLRIGIMTTPPAAMNPSGDVPAEFIRDVERVGRLLEGFGHVVEVSHPAALDEPLSASSLYAAERAALRVELERIIERPLTRDDVEPRTWAMFELAGATSGSRVIAEMSAEQRWSRAVQRWWADGFDLLCTPTLGRSVPMIGELKETADDPLGAAINGYPLAWFTYPFNVTGQPAISVPVPDSDRLPGAVQLVAAWGREDLLLAVAGQLEEELAWDATLPPLIR